MGLSIVLPVRKHVKGVGSRRVSLYSAAPAERFAVGCQVSSLVVCVYTHTRARAHTHTHTHTHNIERVFKREPIVRDANNVMYQSNASQLVGFDSRLDIRFWK
jgi:hypothetical protein